MDTSHQEVWKSGKKTTVLGHEVADYKSRGYTSDYVAPPVAPPPPPPETGQPVIRYDIDRDTRQQDYFAGLDTTPMTDQEKGAERERIRKQMQAQIDSINVLYDQMSKQEGQEGVGRMGQTRAMGARGGLIGSPMGQSQMTKMEGYNQQMQDQINARRQEKVSAIWGRIDERADASIREKEAGIKTNIKDLFAYNEKVKEDSRLDMVDLSESGLALEDITREDYEKMLEQTGHSSMVFDSIYNSHLPKNQRKEYTYKVLGGGNVLRMYVDPETGEMVEEQQYYDIKQGTEIMSAPDGSLIVVDMDANTATPLEGGEAKEEADEGEEMLSIEEAAVLGVPYGTTRNQASEMNITINPEADNRDRYMNTAEGIFDKDTGKIIVKKSYAPKSGGSGGGGMTDAQARTRATLFEKEITEGIKQLESGESWGRVWDSLRRQFSEEEVSNEEIDQFLGGGKVPNVDELGQPTSSAKEEYWGRAEEGYYEEQQGKRIVKNVPEWQYKKGVRSGMTFAERDRILSGGSSVEKKGKGISRFSDDG